VVIELTRGDGPVHSHEVSTGNDNSTGSAVPPLALTLADAKAVLAGMQCHLVQAQVADYRRDRRCCPHCQEQRPLKDIGTRRLISLFGTVEVHAPRFKPCRCSVTSRCTLAPTAEIMPDRCTIEHERIVAKLGARMPYRRTRGFLAEFFPVGDDVPEVETIRQRTLRVGASLERDAVSPTTSSAPVPTARAMTVSIDGGHVRSAHGYQGRTFEVFAALVGNNNGQEVVFSSVPAEANKQRRQLGGVLQGLGVTQKTPVTVLSDGAAGPRTLGEAVSEGPVRHVLDWFHLAMRIQHVAQCVKSWPDTTAEDRQIGADVADRVEHIHWRLWHGQVRRVLDLIGQTLSRLNVPARMKSPTARVDSKMMHALVRARNLCRRARRLDHRPRDSPAMRGTVLDLTHRRCGAMAAAPSDGSVAADAMVTARWSFEAEGSHLHHQRHIRSRSCCRRAMGPPSVSESSVTTPRFWTVSAENRSRRRESFGRPCGH
jgi:hypothetical protein